MYKILIVEDELLELSALKKIITQHLEGCEVIEASRGRDAIAAIDRLPDLDVLLVDLNIPAPNGLEVIRYLRQTNQTAKILVITANDDIDMARNMFSLKVEDYLLKPIRTPDLIATLKRILAFDEAAENQLKEYKIELIGYLERFEYSQWAEAVINYLLNEKASVKLQDVLKQIAQQKSLDLPNFEKQTKLLSTLAYTPQNFYKIVRTLMAISNDIFDSLYKNTQNKFEPVNRAQYYIDRHILQDVTLDDVADNTFISACYLSRLYKKHFGISFSQYVSERKIALAKLLLRHSDLQISQIAFELAYNDVNYFCRLFKKITGITPTAYRAQFEI